ncbi:MULTISPECIES: bifunctional 4-hydroxy-3-methylbut-2-enyl diphosphate reductase/30S ribosomal protein S1 [Tissierellales]|uniref:4-hydroxy-3-methylbut-2-enyl diphosphate reductase n=1 Tax=Acidilutibacter cellobiosedens TaxID=2507161 RepID=A0A410QCX9_9FIRM|nr:MULTISPECIES: bifunctional 4-hydroxy-3-methylbut-2-enyl diphosphate reductase/30S ribosomal protein S1 [Tissierellales]MBE6082034.1 bifunctional 4-hydroxy-3-methylbut-2-enyl diphosphate reductase/30S ribosomal protein S1 [Tissierellaceae bacterium]QAT61714.1 bifunctional 4-hydroxy-3-methylbut-2-enyl diphosphate reductase/30S ribosomal protein S1 [Acidilutibacter cellobiosedens]SCL82596.1 30S ribosomal protein S1 [Sporanaerobacter sp. PP17-6a]
MNILIAEHLGFCFGVKRAVDCAEKEIKNKGENLYSLGPLVHNPQLTDRLKEQGLGIIDDIKDIKAGRVIIRSHGVPLNIYKIIEDNDLKLIDATCPFVKNIQKKVKEFFDKGYKIIIIGDKYHSEIIGINGWCNNEGIIVNNKEEADALPEFDKICVVSQTTNRKEKFDEISNIILKKGKEVKLFNTICNATDLRQTACKEIAEKSDAVIVIGGFQSSNTNKLVEISKKYCKNVFHIETKNDLPIEKISKFNTIGITAGASTPEWIIKEVISTMENYNNEEDIRKALEDSVIRLHRGEIVKGKILSVTDNEIMVNVGYKSDGAIPKEELSNDPFVNPKDLYKEGDEIEVCVLDLDDGEGNVLLSIKKAQEKKGWDEIENIFKEGNDIECKVTEVVKGGVIAIVNGIRAFIPASLASMKYVDDLDVFKGKTIKVKIIDIDRNKNKVILSRKAVEKEELEEKKESLWNTLRKGDIIKGTVKRLTNFGAFVDLGGLDGLIHISDLSWSHIKHPSEVVKEGDNVEAVILDFNKENNRISLGLKQIVPEPWKVFIDENKIGDIVEGEVVNLLDFGAFVRLKEGVDGLIHVSQISNEHINKPSDVLKLGEIVKAKIMDIKEDERRISLSIKEIEKKEEPLKEEEKVDIPKEDMNVTIEDVIKEDK